MEGFFIDNTGRFKVLFVPESVPCCYPRPQVSDFTLSGTDLALLSKSNHMLTLLLILAGLAGFNLFFKFIDWFEKI